ncbi:MAG: ATP phosphoribosyltransferase, partial [Candidatus Brocadiae bacterium]|nr:ATP phosphoribosyltransferase [Candidatus Brocadiia bacterium]
PDDWAEVQTAADLARRAANERLRVATKYPLLVGRFLSEAGAESVRVVSADGALESAPTVGYADFIADITSTGTTLRENRLRPLSDGTILTSQAILIGNRAALQDRPDVLQATRQMLEFIEAHQRARGQYMIFANMRGESAEAVAARVFSQTDLGGLQGPTVAPMITREGAGGWWAINLVSSADKLYAAIQQIRAIGGSGVVVTPVTYIFEELPARYQRLLAALNREETAYLEIAAKDMTITADEVAGFPLERIEAGKALSLTQGVNPAWAAALAAAPAHPEFLLRRAALSLREGLADQAADDYRSVLSSRPAHRAATLGLARALLSAGRGAEALGVLDAWLAQEPGDAEAVKLKERGR